MQAREFETAASPRRTSAPRSVGAETDRDRGGLAALLAGGPAGLSPSSILSLQRLAGNAGVSELMRRASPTAVAPESGWSSELSGTVMRQESPPGAPASEGGAVGMSRKHSIELTPFHHEVNQPLGPFEFKEVNARGGASYEFGAAGGEAENQVHVGVAGERPGGGEPADIGIQAQIDHELQQKILGMDLKVGAGGKVTREKGEVEVEAGIESDHFTASVEFTILGKDWSKPDGIEVLTLTAKPAELKLPFETRVPGSPDPVKVECTVSLELKFDPNWKEIGEWIAEKAADEAAVDAGVSLGFVAAGALTIFSALYLIATSDEVSKKADEEWHFLQDFCAGYQQAMQGKLGRNDRPASDTANGGTQGMARAFEFIDGRAKAPEPALLKQAAARDFYREAADQVWEPVRTKAIQDYWDEHWFQRSVYGDTPEENRYFREFLHVFDAMLENFLGHSFPGSRSG